MNKKTKIIISISASFVILLGLLGLTYGYYISTVNGNTKSAKSLLVTSAKLQLDYGQETNVVKSYSDLGPGSVAATKYFTAKNSGNANVTYSAILEDIDSTFKRSEDLTYTLECTSYNSSGFAINSSGTVTSGTVNGSCSGVSGVKFPLGEMGIMVSNTIAPGYVHYYKLTVNYLSKSVDQSVDMGASFSAKVNIIEPDSLNPYAKDKNTLAYNVINNALIKKDGKTEFLTNPVTTPALDTTERYMSNEDTTITVIDIDTTNQNNYWTFGQGYEIDPTMGTFSLTKVKTCKYNDGSCHRTLKNKYIVSNTASSNSSNSDTKKRTTGLGYVYRIVEAPEATGTLIKMKAVRVYPTRYSAENTLTTAPDDYGTSYYYRGSVDNNYVEVDVDSTKRYCFRIVRIQGDGSIKLALVKEGICADVDYHSGNTTDDKSALINSAATTVFGYDSSNNYNYTGYSGGLRTVLDNWYNTNLSTKQDYLKYESWCLGDRTTKYDNDTGGIWDENYSDSAVYNHETERRLYGYNEYPTDVWATYKCAGESIDSYIGTLLADEVVYAGSIRRSNGPTLNNTFYLFNNAQDSYWILAYSFYSEGQYYAFNMDSTGHLGAKNITSTSGVRPAITLKPGVQYRKGNGSRTNPYKVVGLSIN